MESNNPNIKTWTVLASTENVNKILDKISVDELQKLFAPKGLALKRDDSFDGPFVGFYSIKENDICYLTPTEFVECATADLWGAQRDYRIAQAEYERQHPEIQKKREMEKEAAEKAKQQEIARKEKRAKRKQRGIS